MVHDYFRNFFASLDYSSKHTILVITYFFKEMAPFMVLIHLLWPLLFGSDPVDFLYLPGISGHPAPALHDQ